ncbi:hypothetical protein XHV734_2343 [Xanthomonas hortorum pv. vitians]|nr:hypothetical protein XHV734_2343 [Xanthomonas hortorum pv. vitians]
MSTRCASTQDSISSINTIEMLALSNQTSRHANCASLNVF